MCITPIQIPNRNLVPRKPYTRNWLRVGSPMSLKDCTSQYINVPCGHCPECIQKKQNDFVQRCQMESMDTYQYMVTLTYDNKHLPKLVSSLGEVFYYADYKNIQSTIKRVRKYFERPFRFVATSERGGRRHRPHWHLIVFVPKLPEDSPLTGKVLESELFDLFKQHWSKNIGTNRKPIYEPFFQYVRYFSRGRVHTNYDLHLIEPRLKADGKMDTMQDVSFYVSKYLCKYNDNKLRIKVKNNYSPTEAHYIMETIKCRRITSVSFGSRDFSGHIASPDTRLFPQEAINSYVRECIERSKQQKLEFPTFFYLEGQNYPLSGYLSKKFLNMQDALWWYFNRDTTDIDTVIYSTEKRIDHRKVQNKFKKFDDISKNLRRFGAVDENYVDNTEGYIKSFGLHITQKFHIKNRIYGKKQNDSEMPFLRDESARYVLGRLFE